MKTPTEYICHDCGVTEGCIHHWNCDMEKCPKCGGQLISCGCNLTQKQAERLGRVPYIVWPNMCARCGELWPEMFRIPDDEWDHYVQKSERRKILCWTCYQDIKRMLDSTLKLDTSPIKA